jgi:hypothetical protein
MEEPWNMQTNHREDFSLFSFLLLWDDYLFQRLSYISVFNDFGEDRKKKNIRQFWVILSIYKVQVDW